jgi:hypothetical protein
MNDERQAFEAWCAANGHGTLDDMVAPLDRSMRALMWGAWQAARAASTVPAGWKAAPLLPTKEMWEAGAACCIRTLDAEEDADERAAQYTAIGLAVDVYTSMLAASPASPAQQPVASVERIAGGDWRFISHCVSDLPEGLHSLYTAQPPTPQPPQGAQQEGESREL